MTTKIIAIRFDYLENAYIDNLGNVYKSIEDIPKKYQHLVMPIKEIKPPRFTRRSLRRSL